MWSEFGDDQKRNFSDVYGLKVRGYICDPREMESIIATYISGGASGYDMSNDEFTNFSENADQT